MNENYLLIHGSWHGKWVWEKLVQAMKDKGLPCYTLDLPAHGEKKRSGVGITVRNYVEEVVTFIKEKDLWNITLVGHSMGGMVIPKVAEQVSERISRVVHLAAFVLLDNESISDLASTEFLKLLGEIASRSEDNTIVLPPEVITNRYLNECSPKDTQWVLSKVTPEPYGPILEKVEIRRYYNLKIPKTYIAAKQDRGITLELARKFAGRISCDYYEINGDHDVMVSNPKELAEVLSRLGSPRPI
jgi:pimeloyl-ACP methyl ester carboxylesterase